mgnify:CR=1 FL=1
MSEQRKKNEKNFLVQGSILAIAGVITKLIGAFYRIPLLNIIGTEGNGYYSVAFSIYSVALMLTSYSLPLAVSKLVSARDFSWSHNICIARRWFCSSACILWS